MNYQANITETEFGFLAKLFCGSREVKAYRARYFTTRRAAEKSVAAVIAKIAKIKKAKEQ
jgi:hypothetical protein